jgi:DNA helicase-2/ATP-dependent DNA helicase PcrA
VFPRFISTPPASAATYLTDVEKGERVRHKKFGDGTVTKVEKADNGTVVEIVFDNAGMKRLILEYAKLQAL